MNWFVSDTEINKYGREDYYLLSIIQWACLSAWLRQFRPRNPSIEWMQTDSPTSILYMPRRRVYMKGVSISRFALDKNLAGFLEWGLRNNALLCTAVILCFHAGQQFTVIMQN